MIPFSKYHGLGNDFILLDEKDVSGLNASQLAENLCDRHTGIGADGLIIVKQHPLEMVYYNQDGSRAPMCGNGIRCFSNYCADNGIVSADEFEVKTLAGNLCVQILSQNPFTVKVYMGQPQWEPEKIGAKHKIWGQSVQTAGKTFTLYSFFMATVHTVVFVEDEFDDYERAGKELCFSPLFANQTNVNFVTVLDDGHLKVRTYERGCGLTLACGSGICASAQAARLLGLCKDHVQVQAALGSLTIDMDGPDTYMSGPAQFVCKGDYAL